MKKYFLILLLTLYCSPLKTMSDIAKLYDQSAIQENIKCPTHEKVVMPPTKTTDGYFFYFPEEIIRNANNTDLIEVPVAAYKVLESQALATELLQKKVFKLEKKKISCRNSHIYSALLALKTVPLVIPPEIQRYIIELVALDDTMYVTEQDIVRLLPFLEYNVAPDYKAHPPYYYIKKNLPIPTYNIKIKGRFQRIENPIIESIIFDYQYFNVMLHTGWIRCNNPKDSAPEKNIWYRPRHFKKDEKSEPHIYHYLAPYGPQFREVLAGDEKSLCGDLFSLYEFAQDPTYSYDQSISFINHKIQ
ncbi:MAG: hypothetical protein WC707_02070 [Candidatus Babeliaceae bacterium]|jgi:hypothetical protein